MSRFLAKINEIDPDIVMGDEGQRVMAKNEVLRYLKKADIQVKDKKFGGDTIIVSCNGKDIHLTVTNVTDTGNELQDGEDGEDELDPETGLLLADPEAVEKRAANSPLAKITGTASKELERRLREVDRRLKTNF